MSARASAYAKALLVCPNGEMISPREKLVLIVLADNHQDKAKHFTYPSIETIAEDALCDRRSCQRYLGSLERKGVIKRLRPPRQGAGMTVFYFFTALDAIPEGWQAAALFDATAIAQKGRQKGGKRAAEGRQKGGEMPPFSKAGSIGTHATRAREPEPELELNTKLEPPNPQLALGEVVRECDEFDQDQRDHLERCRQHGEDVAKWEIYYREMNARHAAAEIAEAARHAAFPDCERGAAELMRRCGFVEGNRPDRNPLPKVIAEVLKQQEAKGKPPWETGPRMEIAWKRRLESDGPKWGPLKFYRDGVWLGFVAESGDR